MMGDDCAGFTSFEGRFLVGTFLFYMGTVVRANRDLERVGRVF